MATVDALRRWLRRPLSPWARARDVAVTLVIWAIVLEGAWKLEQLTLKVFGGKEKIWLFQKMEQHRYTAMAMLTGTLRLRAGLDKIGHDEQIYNGAGFTNWGFGVPLLQLPFHWLVPKIPSIAAKYFPDAGGKFFPDRAIFFFYLALMLPVLWAALDRLLAMRERPGAPRLRRHVLSWTATVLIVMGTLYPLMACRFYIYEETICYQLVFQFLALAAYVFALRSGSSVAVLGMAVAAGLGLLIRPIGLVYLGGWGLLLLLERRSWRTIAVFSAGVAPLLTFWLYSNWFRTGSPFATGISNSMPWFDYHTPMLRFGTMCTDTAHHAAEAAARLFNSFFFTIDEDPSPWMKKCHFDFETRPAPPGGTDPHESFFGVAPLLILAWTFLHQLRRGERRLAAYLPHLLFAALFAVYVRNVGGFCWRYADDFTPLVVLACVQYVRFLPSDIAHRVLGFRLALMFAGASAANYLHDIEPRIPMIETLDKFAQKGMWDDFTNSRYSQDRPYSNKLKCESHPDFPYHNGQGWRSGCVVDTFTNVYIGVPDKGDDHYRLQLTTEGFSSPTLRVFVNGRIYEARRTADGYVADVSIHYGRLSSPVVIATVEWTRDFDPIPGRLLSIELS